MKNKIAALLVTGSIAFGGVAGATLASSSAAQGSIPHYKVLTKTVTLYQGQSTNVDLKCPAGMFPVGGGGHAGLDKDWAAFPDTVGVTASSVDPSRRGWKTTLFNNTNGGWDLTAYAVCAVL